MKDRRQASGKRKKILKKRNSNVYANIENVGPGRNTMSSPSLNQLTITSNNRSNMDIDKEEQQQLSIYDKSTRMSKRIMQV
jgi:hypothetical protein